MSLTATSVFTSCSAAAFEALVNLRNGDSFGHDSKKTEHEQNTAKVGCLGLAGVEAGLLVVVITGSLEWLGRALLHVIAKVASYCLPDYSKATGKALKTCTGGVVGAALGLYFNLFAGINAAAHKDVANSVYDTAEKLLRKIPCCNPRTDYSQI
jgi:hypothetical protein